LSRKQALSLSNKPLVNLIIVKAAHLAPSSMSCWIWMIAINITTFILLIVDKNLAKALKNLRIPEILLHIYTLFWGNWGHFRW